LEQVILEIDQLIKQGKASEAKRKFLAIDINSVPRSQRVPLAQIARRMNLARQVLKLLSPYVRPVVAGQFVATTEERALYAVGLTRLGAYQEAEKILSDLDSESFPQVLLFRSHICVFNWDYEAAVPLLKGYIRTLVDPYQLLVAKLNLAAAYFHSGDTARFLPLCQRLISEAESQKLDLVLGNSLELISQYYISIQNFSLASESLNRAEVMLKDSPSQYSLFVKKWRLILNLLQSHSSLQFIEPLQSLKAEAYKNRDWEVIRECDFYQALATKDTALYQQVFEGTSYLGYRKKMRRFSGLRSIPKKFYPWKVPLKLGTNQPPPLRFDLARGQTSGSISNSFDSLTTLPKLHQLLQVLCRDFYKPVPIGEVFCFLYPDEYYSWDNSPIRILQLVKRLRNWFQGQKIPLSIHLERSNISLIAKAPVEISLNRQRELESSTDLLWEKLTLMLTTSSFSSKDVCEYLKISPRSARRLLNWARQRNLIKGGHGTGHKNYRLREKPAKAA
jgi:tetratricopeptide (TPR) repeat protein